MMSANSELQNIKEAFDEEKQSQIYELNEKINNMSFQIGREQAKTDFMSAILKSKGDVDGIKIQLELEIEKKKAELKLIKEKINPVLDEIEKTSKKLEGTFILYEAKLKELNENLGVLDHFSEVMKKKAFEELKSRYEVLSYGTNRLLDNLDEIELKILHLEKKRVELEESILDQKLEIMQKKSEVDYLVGSLNTIQNHAFEIISYKAMRLIESEEERAKRNDNNTNKVNNYHIHSKNEVFDVLENSSALDGMSEKHEIKPDETTVSQ